MDLKNEEIHFNLFGLNGHNQGLECASILHALKQRQITNCMQKYKLIFHTIIIMTDSFLMSFPYHNWVLSNLQIGNMIFFFTSF